jgi:hypothetical protein
VAREVDGDGDGPVAGQHPGRDPAVEGDDQIAVLSTLGTGGPAERRQGDGQA